MNFFFDTDGIKTYGFRADLNRHYFNDVPEKTIGDAFQSLIKLMFFTEGK